MPDVPSVAPKAEIAAPCTLPTDVEEQQGPTITPIPRGPLPPRERRPDTIDQGLWKIACQERVEHLYVHIVLSAIPPRYICSWYMAYMLRHPLSSTLLASFHMLTLHFVLQEGGLSRPGRSSASCGSAHPANFIRRSASSHSHATSAPGCSRGTSSGRVHALHPVDLQRVSC